MADFVTKFHNLEGDLLGERKKNFFKLLTYTSANSNQSDIDNAIQNLKPKTYLEKLFWVETLIYFKKIELLKDVLKQGNREYVKIIVRQKWFIEDAFKDMSAVELVNEFFPCVSYSTRLKLLRRISNCWSEEKVDALFDAVEKRYGIYKALDVLHVCSIPKIKNIVKENEILLSTYQVLHILNKNEDLFKIYIEYHNNLVKKPYGQQNVINLLAYKNAHLFLELLKDNKIITEVLPKAASTKLINIAKRDILAEPEFYLKILNSRALVTKLSLDFMPFYKSFFPKKFQEINSECNSTKLLKHFPKNKRWELFYDTFKTNFPHKNTEELFKVLDSSILKLNPGKDVITTWAEVNYKSSNDENFLQYYPTSTSISIIKEKINVTSDKVKRQNLLMLLITTCAENKDMEALDRIMEYIVSRHANEDPYTYRKIIEFICKTFNNGELSKKHWDFIRQQVILIRTKGTIHFYDYRSIVDQLLGYTYKNDKKLFETVAREYIKDSADSCLYYFRVYLENSDLEREIFAEFCKLFADTVPEDHKFYRASFSSLIYEFFDVCESRPQNCLNLLEYPRLVSGIEAVINKKHTLEYDDKRVIKSAILYHLNFPQYSLPFLNGSKIIELFSNWNSETNDFYGEIVANIVDKDTLSDTEETIVMHFLDKQDLKEIGCWIISDIVHRLFNKHPKYLVKNFEMLYSCQLTYWYKSSIKFTSHLGLDRQVCDYLEKNWRQVDTQQQELALNILQDLLPEEEFIEFVNKNFSPEKPLDETHNGLVTLRIQHHIEDLLKKAKDAVQFLPLVLKFCKGDYLPHVLSSLYGLFSKSSENTIRPYIEILSKGDISARNHAVFLSCELLDIISILNLLKTADSSTNSSLKHLCLATLKYFIKNSSEELFVLSKKYLESVNKSHKEIFSTLVKVKVPVKYRARYVEICWKIFENVDDEKIKVNKYFDKLLEQLLEEEILKSLSPSFVKNTINRYLPIQGKNRLTNIDQFALLCLEYRSTERPNNFTAVFQTLSNLNKRTVSGFCTIFTEYVHTKKPDTQFMNSFVANWNKYFSITDSLDEHIVFNLLLKYSNNSFENYSNSVAEYLEQLIYELGPQVFDMFKTNFEKTMNKFKKLDEYNLLYNMLNHKPSAAICVLVIQLLTPVINEESEELKNVYINITQILDTSNEDIVKSYYESYLRKIET